MTAKGGSTRKAEALTSQQAAALKFARQQVTVYQDNSCHWRKLRSLACRSSSDSVKRTRSVAYALWVRNHWKGLAKHDHNSARHWMVKQTKRLRAETATMRLVMGQSAASSTRRLASADNIEARFNHARREYEAVLHAWRNPPHEQELLCIHRGEGSWNDTRNPKYNGGLQMDKYFEAAYGAPLVIKYGGYIATDASGHRYAVGGHAYLWTPLEQMHAAENAIRTRGFGPWPQTAANCGLL